MRARPTEVIADPGGLLAGPVTPPEPPEEATDG
mgnify:CR=1 FL=1